MLSGLVNRYRAMRVLASDLYPLADPDVENAEEHLETMYDWCMDHGMNVVRITFGGAGALVLAFVTAWLDGGSPSTWTTVAIACSALALAGVGALRLGRLATIHREFSAAQGLLARVRRFFLLMNQSP